MSVRGPGRAAEDDKPYDIYRRTFRFAVAVVQFVRTFPRAFESMEIGRQLLRSGTSVGANLEEADGAESRRDFAHKVGIARKEARESYYWLRICQECEIGDPKLCEQLMSEARELMKILSAILLRTRDNL